jgi:transcriptional regulator with XRE-family HTH domain
MHRLGVPPWGLGCSATWCAPIEGGSATQEELADRSGVSVRGLGKIEAGRISRPRPSTVRLLADAFGLSGAERDRFCAAAGPEPGTIGEPRPAPAQLPPDVTGFTGRADQLRELDMLLDQGDARSVTEVAKPTPSAPWPGSLETPAASATRWSSPTPPWPWPVTPASVASKPTPSTPWPQSRAD